MAETEQTREFRGRSYRICCSDVPKHASHFTYDDEVTVRDSFWNIEEGDRILDVGAAFGSYAMTALACGAGFIWAWSPQGPPGEELMEADYFERSLELNGWSDRCRVMRSGIFDKRGFLNTETQQMVPAVNGDWTVIEVEPLDAWAESGLEGVDGVEWLKIDVEGAEVEVLKSGEATIKRFMPKVFVENHLFKRQSIAQEVKDVLEAFGYSETVTVPYHGVSHSLYLPR